MSDYKERKTPNIFTNIKEYINNQNIDQTVHKINYIVSNGVNTVSQTIKNSDKYIQRNNIIKASNDVYKPIQNKQFMNTARETGAYIDALSTFVTLRQIIRYRENPIKHIETKNRIDSSKNKTIFGKPLYDRVLILESSDDYNDYIKFETDAFSISLKSANNISVSTIKSDYAGSVKEFVGINDDVITITGQIIGKNMDQYDDDKLKNLKLICNSLNGAKITNKYLNDLGVYYIAITDSTFNQNNKFSNIVDFSINCLTDNYVVADVLRTIDQYKIQNKLK